MELACKQNPCVNSKEKLKKEKEKRNKIKRKQEKKKDAKNWKGKRKGIRNPNRRRRKGMGKVEEGKKERTMCDAWSSPFSNWLNFSGGNNNCGY